MTKEDRKALIRKTDALVDELHDIGHEFLGCRDIDVAKRFHTIVNDMSDMIVALLKEQSSDVKTADEVPVQYDVTHSYIFNSEKEACEYAAKLAQNLSDDAIVKISKVRLNPNKAGYDYEYMAYLNNYDGLQIVKKDYQYLIDRYMWD